MRHEVLSVSRQVGAHLRNKGPAEGLNGIQTHNLSAPAVPRDAGSTTELSPFPSFLILKENFVIAAKKQFFELCT